MSSALLVIDFHLNITRNIADTQKRGYLDFNDFSLGMYLIQGIMSGQLSSVPPSIPTHIYEQIRTFDKTTPFPSPKLSEVPPPIPKKPPQSTAESPSFTAPPKPDRTRSSPLDATQIDDWDVTPAERLDADHHYDTLDPDPSGYVEGDVAAKFLLRFKLPPEDLAHIWYFITVFWRQIQRLMNI